MSLSDYFQQLIEKAEASDAVTNQGTDTGGFYKPTRTILLRNLQILKDLHQKPLAKPMLKTAWAYVVEHAPPEWLILNEKDKAELQKILE